MLSGAVLSIIKIIGCYLLVFKLLDIDRFRKHPHNKSPYWKFQKHDLRVNKTRIRNFILAID